LEAPRQPGLISPLLHTRVVTTSLKVGEATHASGAAEAALEYLLTCTSEIA